MRALICVVLVAVAAPAAVYAQPTDVPGLIKLIENQPSDMDRSTWKEKRRDAARKLGQSKDKRAVPVLINLAETETFDIIGDIAIEGLGNLKDQAAVPVLQKIVGDVSRDKSSRELARKALAKLGAPATPPAGGGSAAGGGGGSGSAGSGSASGGGAGGGSASAGGGASTGGHAGGGGATGGSHAGGGGSSGASSGGAAAGGGASGGGGEASSGGASGGVASGLETGGTVSGDNLLGGTSNGGEVPRQPDLGDDVIAAFERLTFVAGTAGLSYDTARSRLDFDADAAGRYQRRIDTETRTLGIDVGASVVAGVTNPEGRGVTRGIVIDVHEAGEARFYSGKLYGVGKLAIDTAFQQFSYRDQNNPDADVVGSDARTFTADLQLALGGGYGRVIDVGSAIRVQRLGRTLDAARALGKPIDAATSKKLQLTWWALRGARSSYESLIATIAILREAGILLGEPSAAITYEILQVLQDTQLYLRPSGLDLQLVFGEGYLYRPDSNDDDICDLNIASKCGRVEQLIASAGYGTQLDEDKLEISGDAYARYRVFAGENEPSPWALGATARMRRFTYGAHGEQFGMFDVRGTVALSSDASTADPCDGFGCDKSLRIEGELGFTYLINQASGLRLAAHVAEDAGEIFFGARLEATYGLLDGLFAR